MKDDLQKSDSCGLKSERKKILTSSTCSLACLSTNLGAFCPMVVHLPSEKSILPYFSGPRGVAILDCDSHSQAGSTKDLTRLTVEWRSGKVKIRSNKGQYWPKTLDKYLRHYHSPASKADWRRFMKKNPGYKWWWVETAPATQCMKRMKFMPQHDANHLNWRIFRSCFRERKWSKKSSGSSRRDQFHRYL